MPGVATGNVDSAGGTQINQVNSWYRINTENVVVVGDVVAGHGEGEHGSPVMAEGEPWYRVNTIDVSRKDHLASCGHPTTGRDWYRLSSGAFTTASPTQIKARKGTYFYGGAGMNGDYIADFIRALRSAGIENAKIGSEARWSYQSDYELVEMVADAGYGVLDLRDSETNNTDISLSDYGITGEQFNIIGYSYGALVAAQVAIKYARNFNGFIDHLVLIGAPISQNFLDELQAEPLIGQIHIFDLIIYGDPIYAGMSYIELLAAITILGVEYKAKAGHFYYSKEGEEGADRQRNLANALYSQGLR